MLYLRFSDSGMFAIERAVTNCHHFARLEHGTVQHTKQQYTNLLSKTLQINNAKGFEDIMGRGVGLNINLVLDSEPLQN